MRKLTNQDIRRFSIIGVITINLKLGINAIDSVNASTYFCTRS
jgi:hypothetical protein